MDKSLRDKVEGYKSTLKILSLETHAFAARRSKLLDGCYRALNDEAVIAIQSFLLLSQDLEDAYRTILGSWWRKTTSKLVADDLFQRRHEGINNKIEAVQHSLARLDSNANAAYIDLVSLGIGLNEHYNGKVLALQRGISATRMCLEDDVSRVTSQLEEGEREEESLQARTKELLAESENLKDARNASDRRAKHAAEAGFCSLALGLILLILGLIIFPLFVMGLGMLGWGGAQGGVHLFASKRRTALEKEINAIQKRTESINQSISTVRSRLIELNRLRKELQTLFKQISDMSSQTEQLCTSSREAEKLFTNDQVQSTDNLCAAKKIAHTFETMKFKSTQQEVLRLMKMVAKNVTSSAEHKHLLLKTTRPERTKLQKLSCLLEKSLINIEVMCPAISELLQDRFDENLHRKIEEIGPCGIKEPLWTAILSWSFYLIRRWTNLFLTATYGMLLSHKHFFTYFIGWCLLCLAILSGCMLEQVVVVWTVFIVVLNLPSLPSEAEPGDI